MSTVRADSERGLAGVGGDVLLTSRVIEFIVSPAMELELSEVAEVLPIPQAQTVRVNLNTALPASSFSASVTNEEDADHFTPTKVEVQTEVRERSHPPVALLFTAVGSARVPGRGDVWP